MLHSRPKHAHDDIRIGTLVPAHDRTAAVIAQLLPHGFETFQVSFGRTVGDFDLAGLTAAIRRVLETHAVGELAHQGAGQRRSPIPASMLSQGFAATTR